MTPYIKLEITIGAETLIIARDSVYRLLEGGIDGIEAADLDVRMTEYAAADGGYADGVKIHPREITIQFAVDDRRQTEVRRDRLIHFFKPKASGTLIVERNSRRRKIRFYLASRPVFKQGNIKLDRLRVSIELLCPDPYFEDENAATFMFMRTLPLLTFPFNSLAGVGITAGTLISSNEMTLTNGGDVPVGIVCEITAHGGTVTNPCITMNGQYVKALTVLNTGSVLKIDTRTGQKNIYIDGESQFIFDRCSVFFQLPAGDSQIAVSADAGILDAKARFTYSFKYLGA